MKLKKMMILVVMLVPFLFSCSSNPSDASYSSNMSGTSIETSEPISEKESTSGLTSSPWNEKTRNQMLGALGCEMPYINEFAENYQVIMGTMADSTIPYVNLYVEGASNWVNSYKTALIKEGYLYDSEDFDDGVTWYNYYKNISIGRDLDIRFAFYYNEGSNWFDVYGNLSTGGGGLDIPDTADYKLLPDIFGLTSDPYKTGEQVLEIEDLSLTYLDVKSQLINKVKQIQFKKGSGCIYNNLAMSPISLIYLEDANNYTNFRVYGGNSLANMTLITTYNGVYGLNGATYFKIESANINVGTLTSIQIVLQ